MEPDCIFCRIVAGELPARVVYRDDEALAFQDIHPQASVHLLVIPTRHIASLHQARDLDPALLGRLLQVASQVAEGAGIAQSGYRVVTNTGPDADQSVAHLHFHVLGGNQLRPRLG